MSSQNVPGPTLIYRPTSYCFLFELERGRHRCEHDLVFMRERQPNT
jgi:hypothetical protein